VSSIENPYPLHKVNWCSRGHEDHPRCKLISAIVLVILCLVLATLAVVAHLKGLDFRWVIGLGIASTSAGTLVLGLFLKTFICKVNSPNAEGNDKKKLQNEILQTMVPQEEHPLARISHTFSEQIAALPIEIASQVGEDSVHATRPRSLERQDQSAGGRSVQKKCEKSGLEEEEHPPARTSHILLEETADLSMPIPAQYSQTPPPIPPNEIATPATPPLSPDTIQPPSSLLSNETRVWYKMACTLEQLRNDTGNFDLLPLHVNANPGETASNAICVQGRLSPEHLKEYMLMVYRQTPCEVISFDGIYLENFIGNPICLTEGEVYSIDFSACSSVNFAQIQLNEAAFSVFLEIAKTLNIKTLIYSYPLSLKNLSKLLQDCPSLTSLNAICLNEICQDDDWSVQEHALLNLSLTLVYSLDLEKILNKFSCLKNLQSFTLWIDGKNSLTMPNETYQRVLADLVQRNIDVTMVLNQPTRNPSIFEHSALKSYVLSTVVVERRIIFTDWFGKRKPITDNLVFHLDFFRQMILHYRHRPDVIRRLLDRLFFEIKNQDKAQLEHFVSLSHVFCDAISEDALIHVLQNDLLFSGDAPRKTYNVPIEYFLRKALIHCRAQGLLKKANMIVGFLDHQKNCFLEALTLQQAMPGFICTQLEQNDPLLNQV
jgi:hypothetical protein